jgi:hypothetical protein
MDLASLRAAKARYGFVMLSLLSGMSFFAHVSLVSAAVDADDALSLCQIDTLPKDIRDTLDRRFYGWRVQEAINLLPKARQKWAATAPLACPGIAAGHFEESRSVSYALLLVPGDRATSGYKFVVFSAPKGQSFYGFKLLDQGDINASGYFIHSAAIERVLDGDHKKRLKPKGSDGIVLFAVDDKGEAQSVFFWNGESYDHAQVDYQ